MKNFHPDNNCPVRNVLCRLGDKWSMLVLITLNANGTMRFCDIHKTIADISQRMLTVTLRTLETDGLVSRKVYAEVPPRVEYELTERGKSLIPHIEGLVDWALQQMPGIMESRSQTGTALKKIEKKLLIYLFLLEIYYFCSVFNNNKNKMKALYNTYFFFFYYFYFSNKVKREFVCVR